MVTEKRMQQIKAWKESPPEKQLSYVKKYNRNNSEKVATRQHQYTLQKIRFGGKQIRTNEVVRTGKCSKCLRRVEDGEIKVTHMHHEQYDSNNPLAHTIELCVRCHNKEHRN